MTTPSGDHHPPAGVSKVGMAWGFAILFIVVVMTGGIASFFEQIGEAFQVIKMFTPQILILLGAAAVAKAVFGKKPPPPPPQP